MRNKYPDFTPVPAGELAEVTRRTEALAHQLGIVIRPDRVLSAPWVGRIYTETGETRSSSTSEGWLRNESRFWSAFRRVWDKDYKLLKPGHVVSKPFAKTFGWSDNLIGEKLVHHHIENGPYCVPIPESLHKRLYGKIHAEVEIGAPKHS